MRSTIALAAAAFLALGLPALAQEAGAPGAVGTGGSLTGSNPGSSYGWNNGWNNGGYGYNNGWNQGWTNGWNGPGYAYRPSDRPDGAIIYEGRGAAQDYDEPAPYPAERYNNGYNYGYGYHNGW